MGDDGTDFWKYCAHCGSELGLGDWPPVVDVADGGDGSALRSFCDEACRAAWNGD